MNYVFLQCRRIKNFNYGISFITFFSFKSIYFWQCVAILPSSSFKWSSSVEVAYISFNEVTNGIVWESPAYSLEHTTVLFHFIVCLSFCYEFLSRIGSSVLRFSGSLSSLALSCQLPFFKSLVWLGCESNSQPSVLVASALPLHCQSVGLGWVICRLIFKTSQTQRW